MPTFEDRILGVCARPGMYVIEETYLLVSTFISGAEWAQGNILKDVFREWLKKEYRFGSSMGWPYLVEDIYERTQVPQSGEDVEARKIAFLHDLLRRFFSRIEREQENGIGA